MTRVKLNAAGQRAVAHGSLEGDANDKEILDLVGSFGRCALRAGRSDRTAGRPARARILGDRSGWANPNLAVDHGAEGRSDRFLPLG